MKFIEVNACTRYNKIKSNKFRCYYLLYKLRNNHLLWIVRVSDIIEDFFEHVTHIEYDKEQYYIIEKQVYNLEKEFDFKRFAIFTYSETSKIIAKTN